MRRRSVVPPGWLSRGLLLLVFAVGLFVRVEDLARWPSTSGCVPAADVPLVRSLDSYYYLALARDLLDGTYHPIDEKRSVPENPPRPVPPPLLSVLAVSATKLTPLSLNQVAVYLPAFLGPLLALPLYALGRVLGGRAMGLSAALIGVLHYGTVSRSSVGWFDTDCLNAAFAVAPCYAFLRFGTCRGRRRYLFFTAGAALYALFLWWWHMAPSAVTFLCVYPALASLALFYRAPARERCRFLAAGSLGLALLLAWRGLELPLRLAESAWQTAGLVTGMEEGPFPSVAASIGELRGISLGDIVPLLTGSVWVLLAAAGGLAVLCWRRPRESLLLLGFVALGGLAFPYGRRFLLFTAPAVALGGGSLAAELWRWRARHPVAAATAPVLVLLLAWPSIRQGCVQDFRPKLETEFLRQLARVRDLTSPEAVVWSWWDEGYPIIYASRRATVNDGGRVTSGERTLYNAIPLASPSRRLAANFMQFYTVRGMRGVQRFYAAAGDDPARGLSILKRIFEAGPRRAGSILEREDIAAHEPSWTSHDWLAFLFPDSPPPLYLLLHWRLMLKAHWWYWFGTYDIAKGEGVHPFFRVFREVRRDGDRILGSPSIEVDLDTGQLHQGGMSGALAEIAVDEAGRREVRRYYHPEAMRASLVAFPEREIAILADPGLSGSTYFQLLLGRGAAGAHFRPVLLETPSFQLWEVRGDSLEAPTPRGLGALERE